MQTSHQIVYSTSAHLCLLSIGNSWPTFPAPDTLHSNELAVRCIHDSMHFFVPLPHKQLAFFSQTGESYVISCSQQGLGEKQIWTSFDMRRPPPPPHPTLVRAPWIQIQIHVIRRRTDAWDRLDVYRLQSSLSSVQLSCEVLHNCGVQWETICPGMSLFQLRCWHTFTRQTSWVSARASDSVLNLIVYRFKWKCTFSQFRAVEGAATLG